jgi:decaprenyl-phosphate phosphoribosyltransferase
MIGDPVDQSGPVTEPRAAAGSQERLTSRNLVQALRPRQWTKNLLVFAPLVAAGLQLDATSWARASVSFVSFCLAASAMYLINDVADVEHDRRHPRKRHRPVASGLLSIRTALVFALLMLVFAIGLSLSLNAATALVVATYAALHIAYSMGLKRVPIVEMLVVAAGFVLRGVGGGFAIGVEVSQWFLLVTAAGALFVITGKRYSELSNHPEGGTRDSLVGYEPDFLRGVLAMTSTATVMGYVLWSFGVGRDVTSFLDQITAVPFTLAILLYWADVIKARGEAPDVLLTTDRLLVAAIGVWALLYMGATLSR